MTIFRSYEHAKFTYYFNKSLQEACKEAAENEKITELVKDALDYMNTHKED